MSKLEAGRQKTGGRKKGTPNRTTQALKDAILIAATEHGEDDKGKDGLVGYLRKVAREDVKAFSGLLGKVIPTQIAGPDDENGVPGEIVLRVIDAGG